MAVKKVRLSELFKSSTAKTKSKEKQSKAQQEKEKKSIEEQIQKHVNLTEEVLWEFAQNHFKL